MYSLLLTPAIMIPFQNPTIFFGTLRIDEPISVLTDVILCAICFYAFYKTKSLSTYKAINLYRWFFLLTGVSTIVSAVVGHAFLYYFGVDAKIYGWLFGISGITCAQFAAIYNTRLILGNFVFKRLVFINSLGVIAAFIAVFISWSFVVVEIHGAFGLLLNVTILEYINYKKTGSPLSIKVIYGIGLAVVAVLCHIFQFAYSVWFNHIDLSHVFMALSMYVIYRGICLHEEITPSFRSI